MLHVLAPIALWVAGYTLLLLVALRIGYRYYGYRDRETYWQMVGHFFYWIAHGCRYHH